MKFFNRPKNLNDADDDKLLTSYRESGDLAVLYKIYEKQVPLVYGVCLKYLKDEDKAKDAVMGIFEELVNKVKAHEITHFHSWLYVLSKNYCLMQIRAAGSWIFMSSTTSVWHSRFCCPWITSPGSCAAGFPIVRTPATPLHPSISILRA